MNSVEWTKEELEAVREVLKKTNISTHLSYTPEWVNARTSPSISLEDWDILEEFIRYSHEEYSDKLSKE